jgi:hypothetical protein
MAWWQWLLISIAAWFVVAGIVGVIIGKWLKRNTGQSG